MTARPVHGAPATSAPVERAPVTGAPNRNAAQAQALFEGLAAAGVRDVCLCPGSRSTPLVVAAGGTPGLRVRVHLDERSAGFFALGLAKASRAPVALVCTSGTAAANFLPAVVEASLARVPLVVLTADRPPELRDWGAAQTIDQLRLFGSHVRWFAELPTPEPTAALLRHARATVARAVAVALADPAGPVHLDVPYREPLEPVRVEADAARLAAIEDARATGSPSGATHPRVVAPRAAPPPALVERLARELSAVPRGVLCVGPQDDDPALPAAVARLARAARWPLLADGASQLRSGVALEGAPVCTTYDAFLRHEPFAAAHEPELAIRFGLPLTSKAASRWLERSPRSELRLVDPGAGFLDPAHRASEILRVDPVALCDALARALEQELARASSRWLDDFLAAERATRAALDDAIATEPVLFAPRVVRELAAALPDGATLYVSNSMAIRDVDGFLPAGARRLRVLCNRGANGIDGVPSAALGAAAALAPPVALLTGDLAFLHDAGGLLAAKRHGLSLLCVVVNDDGGGIFSYLPIAGFGEQVGFEERFATPHGVDLARLTALAEGTHRRVRSGEELALALKEAAAAPGLRVIEVPADREAQVAHHLALWNAVGRALDAAGRPS
ncbi:MAG TPA: 2-succinyl-5-enolpyruvyl-6-hydroxy-3-cyclohexene-1-carboxylic-acid synthase [Myxococcota bacterium]|nr:2-succinyl-5-enolpyruvyl-6-hydroxy-3-cyclohexene-1-carboxylic-acid synthase [Myxococcota bacterium]